MRRFAVTLVVLVVMSPTVAMAADWYRCTMDGQARAACCCPGEGEEREDVPPDAPPDARSACCCDIDTVRIAASEPRMKADPTGPALGVLVVPRVVIAIQTPATEVVIRRTPSMARPSSRAPPLFLSHCSLLL